MVKKWLIYLILFLLTANIALVVSMLVKTSSANDQKVVFKKEGADPRAKQFQEHLIAELGFNSEQQRELKKYGEEFYDERIETKREIWGLKKQYFELLAKENPDTAQLNEIARKIGILEADRIKQDYKHYHNVRSICSEEQARRFDSLGRSHMNMHLNKHGKKKYRHHSDSLKECRNK